MITSSLATTASCPSGDQRRQSRTFGRSLNLTSRSIFRNGFEDEGIRGPAEGGRVDNGSRCRYGFHATVSQAFFSSVLLLIAAIAAKAVFGGITFYALA